VQAKALKLYPNPSDEIFCIELPREEYPLIIRIYNWQGTMTEHKASRIGNNKLKVQIAGKATGMYFVELVFNTATYREKLMIN
jgi:hypothetical protein